MKLSTVGTSVVTTLLLKYDKDTFGPVIINDTLDIVSNEKYYLQNCFIEPLLLNNNYFSDQDIFSLATEQ